VNSRLYQQERDPQVVGMSTYIISHLFNLVTALVQLHQVLRMIDMAGFFCLFHPYAFFKQLQMPYRLTSFVHLCGQICPHLAVANVGWRRPMLIPACDFFQPCVYQITFGTQRFGVLCKILECRVNGFSVMVELRKRGSQPPRSLAQRQDSCGRIHRCERGVSHNFSGRVATKCMRQRGCAP
jgi:hypothetical protein